MKGSGKGTSLQSPNIGPDEDEISFDDELVNPFEGVDTNAL